MDFRKDRRIVMTFNLRKKGEFVFTAIQGGEEIVNPVVMNAEKGSLSSILDTIEEGFRLVMRTLNDVPTAISFPFPGPADYSAGIIGDLSNFPAFRGGVPLGPYLKEKFKLPIFINNDGDLFTYGEAIAGALPELNQKLLDAGIKKQYKNLIGIIIGTGFGAGIMINNHIIHGDNGTAGEICYLRDLTSPRFICEETVSSRGIVRIYNKLSGEKDNLLPEDILAIAEGKMKGNKRAAISAFAEMGYVAGEALASVLTLIDGVAVVGGKIEKASPYFMPALLNQMNSKIEKRDGTLFSRIPQHVFNLDDERSFQQFIKDSSVEIEIPGTNRFIPYFPYKRSGVMVSKLGESKAVMIGAYVYALNHL
ncbi:MAG TPA: hypothetical protein DDY68_01075 [Porphyromonadaceae bacterium]|nr:hypothetical protein [Porphyromonadaceae bacterium]